MLNEHISFADFATHETPSTGYEKQWDKTGWKQPEYGPASEEEEKAGCQMNFFSTCVVCLHILAHSKIFFYASATNW